jgi:sugar/nucleoside kinase (ribokinase family)
MATDVLILNTAVLDVRSPDFGFADGLVGAGGLAKCPPSDMPAYSQEQIKSWIDRGCATAGGPGNTAPLLARAGLKVAVGVNLGRGTFGGLDIQGRTFHDILVRNGVDMSAVFVHPSLPTAMTFIHEAPNNERGGIAYFPNANNDFDFEYYKGHVQRLKPTVVYYMYSGLSDRGDAHGGKDLADFIAWCRRQGCITIVDSHTLTGNPHELIAKGTPVPAYRLLAPLKEELDIFFTSADEAKMIRNTLDPDFRKTEPGDRDSIPNLLDFIAGFLGERKAGRTQLFGVTVSNGAYVRLAGPGSRGGKALFCKSRFMAGEVIDLVGAGDSFRAGVISYIVTHSDSFRKGDLNVEEAVQTGNLVASLFIKASLHDRYGNIANVKTLIDVVRSGREFGNFDELTKALGIHS